MKLELAPVSLSLRRPMVTAHGSLLERAGLRVTLTAEGVTGRGEAFPLVDFGTESLEACTAALKVARVPSFDAVEALQIQGLDGAPAARFAVECAALEWLALRRGVPVGRLLGVPHPVVVVNALIDGDDAASLADAARRAVDAGFRTVKVKVAARSLTVDAQRLQAVRLAVGPHIAIRIDANGGWSEATARGVLRGLEPLSLELCEQPVNPRDVESLRRLTAQVPVAIAADEVLASPAARERVLAADPRPAAKILVLKPAVLGGLLPALALGRQAAQVGVRSYVTTLIDGPISRSAAAHMASVLPQIGFSHGLSTVELFRDLPADAFTPRRGAIELPSSAGWGI